MASPSSTNPDINNPELMNEVVEVQDGASSENFFAAPIMDDGEHLFHISLGKRGIKANRQWDKDHKNRDGAAFLNVHFMLRELLTNGEEGSGVAFDNATSIIMQSAGTSRLHSILDLAGFPVPNRATLGELKTAVEAMVASPNRVKATTQWQAQVEVSKDEYETVLKGQSNFPSQGDLGRKSPDFTDPKSGKAVSTQAQVIKYARA